jgi:hypothetical protein
VHEPAPRQLAEEPPRPAEGPGGELAALRAEIAVLREQVRGLGVRVARLEAAASSAPAASEDVAVDADADARGEAAAAVAAATAAESSVSDGVASGLAPDAAGSPSRLALFGRFLLVLAGAFLLRAATEGGRLPAPVGVLAGLAYALAWLPPAHRAGRRGDGPGAVAHALATLVIAYPLVFEATARFRVFGTATSALALAGLTALLLHAGWRQRSPAIAWLVLAATAATAAALTVAAGAPALFAALLVGLAGACLALGEQRGWRPLGAASAAVAVFATAVVTAGTLVPHPLAAAAALPVQLSLLLLYLGVVAALATAGRAPGWPLRAQAVAAVVVGWGGALLTAGAAPPRLALAIGVVGLLLAAAAELFVLSRLADGPAPLRRVFAGAAVAFFLGGTALVLASPPAAWIAAAVAAVALGRRAPFQTLAPQGALLAAAALLASGATRAATTALLLPASPPGHWSVLAAATIAAAGACLPILVVVAPPLGSRARNAAVVLLLALGTWSAAGALVAASRPVLGDDAGALAALGTVLLSLAAALLAFLGRASRLAVATRLVYPLLAATALKLLLVDVAHGTPLALFVSLGALGSAVLLAARTARRA